MLETRVCGAIGFWAILVVETGLAANSRRPGVRSGRIEDGNGRKGKEDAQEPLKVPTLLLT